MIKRTLFFCGALLLIMASCMQAPDDADLVKYMVVQTEYNTEKITDGSNIFNTYGTYVLRQDTMGFVSSFSPNDTILVDNPTFDFVKPVVRSITTKINEAGFTRVAEDQNPDFAVKVVVLQNFSFFQTVTYPGYYSGYYGYYGGYYGPIVNNYYSNFITMVVEVVDVKNFGNNNNKYVVIWSAYVGDLGKTMDLKQNTLDAVERAFQQSPYFSKD